MRASTTSAQTSNATPPRSQKKEKEEDATQPLLSAICHDLRAPLASVTMGANFVLQTTPEGEASGRSRRVLQAMLRSCKQMERLVRDFADLSEIEAHVVELRAGVHDAREMLAIAAQTALTNAGARNVELQLIDKDGNAAKPPRDQQTSVWKSEDLESSTNNTTDATNSSEEQRSKEREEREEHEDGEKREEPVLLRCDRDRVLRALGHLIDNAIRFAPEGSAIALSATEVGGEVIMSVTDRGPGLDDETLAHLYDRTWHAKRADRVGAGLGLAIARGFVTEHNGRIEVASEPGSETTFSLIIPRDTPSIPPRPPSSIRSV